MLRRKTEALPAGFLFKGFRDAWATNAKEEETPSKSTEERRVEFLIRHWVGMYTFPEKFYWFREICLASLETAHIFSLRSSWNLLWIWLIWTGLDPVKCTSSRSPADNPDKRRGNCIWGWRVYVKRPEVVGIKRAWQRGTRVEHGWRADRMGKERRQGITGEKRQ